MRKIKRGISVPRQPFYKIAFRRACEKTFQILQDARMGAAQCVIFLRQSFLWSRFLIAFLCSIHSPSSGGSFFEFACICVWKREIPPRRLSHPVGSVKLKAHSFFQV